MTPPAPPPEWIPTQATVTSCRFQFAGLGNLAFGFSTLRSFRIEFAYTVQGRLYSGVFQSRVAIPQNEPIPIAYNPLRPEENTRASTPAARTTVWSSLRAAHPTRSALLVIALAGSLLLALLWLPLLRSCN